MSARPCSLYCSRTVCGRMMVVFVSASMIFWHSKECWLCDDSPVRRSGRHKKRKNSRKTGCSSTHIKKRNCGAVQEEGGKRQPKERKEKKFQQKRAENNKKKTRLLLKFLNFWSLLFPRLTLKFVQFVQFVQLFINQGLRSPLPPPPAGGRVLNDFVCWRDVFFLRWAAPSKKDSKTGWVCNFGPCIQCRVLCCNI